MVEMERAIQYLKDLRSDKDSGKRFWEVASPLPESSYSGMNIRLSIVHREHSSWIVVEERLKPELVKTEPFQALLWCLSQLTNVKLHNIE